MSNLLPIALRFLAQGISVVPTANDGSKRPAFAWQGFQEHLPIADELLMWFKDGVDGIGVITGKVSGNLEMLELEGRAVAEKMHLEIAEIANNSGLGDLWQRLNSGFVQLTTLHIHMLIGLLLCVVYVCNQCKHFVCGFLFVCLHGKHLNLYLSCICYRLAYYSSSSWTASKSSLTTQ